jgi:hypothetical protein
VALTQKELKFEEFMSRERKQAGNCEPSQHMPKDSGKTKEI